ncbi:MAG: hypothetical protein Q7R67_00200 [bacterium]|nr:hypothetical protein [bacterium]
MEQHLSVAQAASEVIQHACENFSTTSRQDELCGEILAALTIAARVDIQARERHAFVSRWQSLLPEVLRANGRAVFAVIVEQKLEELL